VQIVRKESKLVVDGGYRSGVAGKVCHILLGAENSTCLQQTVQQLCVVTPIMWGC